MKIWKSVDYDIYLHRISVGRELVSLLLAKCGFAKPRQIFNEYLLAWSF